jgi:hypothetical protein
MRQFEVRMRATRRAETALDRSLDHGRSRVGTTCRLRHKFTHEQCLGHSETGLFTADGPAKDKPMIDAMMRQHCTESSMVLLSAGVLST